MIDRELIKAEIERLKRELDYEPFTDEVLGKQTILKQLISFIDSLPEEPVSEDMEEASKAYAESVNTITNEALHSVVTGILTEAYEAGARWYKEQMTIRIYGSHPCC